MTTTRALLTDREREVLKNGPDAPDISKNHYYDTRHRLKKRISKRLGDDLAIIIDDRPGLITEIIEIAEAAQQNQHQEEQTVDA